MLYGRKEAVRTLLRTEEKSVYPYPLGTCQGRYLHIVGTLHDGYAHLLQAAVTTLTFVWRRHKQVGLEVHYLLYVHGIAHAKVADTSFGNGLFQLLMLQVLGIEQASYPVCLSQLCQQGGMCGRVYGSPLHRHLHPYAPERGACVPRVADVYADNVPLPDGADIACMSQGQGVAFQRFARPAIGARGKKKARKDYRPKVFHEVVHRLIACKFTPFSFNCFPRLVFYDKFTNFAGK